MALPEEILINLAANLAAELITRAGGRLRDLAFGDAETRALGRAWQRAFQAMLQAVAADLSAADANLLADIWREFVAAEGVAGALLDLALAGDDPPLPELRARFDALDFERATLAVDFDAALAALTRGLDAALLDEAEQPGSPLYNRVSLRRLTAMHRLLRRDAPPYRPGVPFQAPAVPRYFVPRPEVSAALMAYLSADAPHGALVVSAVHGLGGIGKTTLVAALAREPAVEARFPDGVLWATLGQTPDVLSLLADWIQALGDYDFRPTVAESATAHLGTLLHAKACLLVVDDAWDAGHVRPFLVGGPRCRLVVTTRDAALARKVGAQLYDLDVMSEAQALALFEARLGPLDGDRGTAAALARELGYLPLALELAAAQVEAGCAWAELLDAFRHELADLAALDLDEASYRNESLRLSFRLSLERLAPEEQAAFAWLGVLPEDARLNPALAATLWECEEVEARKRLRRLRDRALLKPVGDDRYTLHDLLHDEARLRLAEEMPLPQAHARLLARYKRRHHIAYDQWHRLPNDGYIHERLTWHLEQAGQPEAIHALLRLETEEKRNAWYEAREALGQTAGYLDDVRRAWRLATLPPPPGPLPSPGRERGGGGGASRRGWGEVIGLQCRYALIVASLNSLAKNLPPELIAALVEEKVWTPAQGLAYARQTPEPEQRAETLAELTPHLPEAEHTGALREALAAVQEIEIEEIRAYALNRLVPHLPEAERAEALREAVAAAWEIEDEQARAETLAGLAWRLAELGYPEEALVTAQEVDEEGLRVTALVLIVPYLSEPLKGQTLQEALAAAQAIEKENDRAELLGLAQAIRDADDQIQTLMTLVKPPEPEDYLLILARWRAQGTEDRWKGAKGMVLVASYLPKPERDRVLREALAKAWGIEDGNDRAAVLVKLAPYLPKPLLQEALAAVRAIKHADRRASALAKLVPRLAELGYPEEALATAREIESEEQQAKSLAGLAPYLPEPLLREALAAAWEIEDERRRGEALARLAPRLAELGYLEEALATAREIEDEGDRASALTGLVPHLPEPLKGKVLHEALAAARGEIIWVRDGALARLALRLAELGYPEESLTAAQEIRDANARATVLTGLVTHLPEVERAEVLREALAAAREIERKDVRVSALTGLASHLPEAERAEALCEALTAARGIGNEWLRAWAMAGLTPRLQEPLKGRVMQEALAAAQEIKGQLEYDQVGVGYWHVLFTIGTTCGEVARFVTLARLVSHLPEIEQADALREALAAVPETWRLGPYLSELPVGVLRPLWHETLPVLAARTRKELLADLSALAPVIHALGGQAAIEETFRAVQDVGRWWE